MNYHCWRNAKAKVDEDDELTWPKLPYPGIQERSHPIKNAMTSRVSTVDLADLSEHIERMESLDERNYPKLDGIFPRRKNSFAEFKEMAVVASYGDRTGRRPRIPRSTDLIYVNLQKTLESENWPISTLANHGRKITVDICKLNVNMSVGSPLAKWLLTKSKRKLIHVGKKKKLSRLKGLILYERMMRKQENSAGKRIQEVTFNPISEDVTSTINFDNLRINVVFQDDPELLKKMSALSCLSAIYRDSKELNYPEDNCIFRPDLHDRMEQLSIEAIDETKLSVGDDNESNERNADFIDAEIMKATESLKIDSENEKSDDKILIEEEPSRPKFTKKFREYCTNTITSGFNIHLEDFLAEISRLQKRMYERDKIKGQNKRRYYSGIKEVRKHIDLKKIKFVIIAPDLEKVEAEGGLDDTVGKLVGSCKRYEVPYCFGLGRRKLGYYTHGKGFVSCIGIANYSGAEEKLKNVLLEVAEARNNFSRSMSDEAKTIEVEKLLPKEGLLPSEIINAYLKIIASTS